jgi:hypothetical protein
MLLSFAVTVYDVQKKNQKNTKQDYQLGIFLSQELTGKFLRLFYNAPRNQGSSVFGPEFL